jgi:serine/threonine protein kinase
MTLARGTRLGPYEILDSLGAGGMGEVYKARDPRLNRDVAIKVLSPRWAMDADALGRFEREAMSVAKLSHANILSIFEFAREGTTEFVVTELVDGDTLRARLVAGALPIRRAVSYALQIARGLAAAHARGVVHRDLKPENVMITREDQIKILDFGLAKSLDPSEADITRGGGAATSVGTVLGTFGYMAPEQVRGRAVDHRADIFSFGAVLYEMLSGVRPFQGETAADTMSAVLTKEPPDWDAARTSISPGLDRIVRRCLEKSPQLRFQSAIDLAFALENLSAGSTASAVAQEIDVASPRMPVALLPANATISKVVASWLPWTVAAMALIGLAASWLTRPAPSAREYWDSFTRISESAGEETSPALSARPTA